jgi:hypothetical protein
MKMDTLAPPSFYKEIVKQELFKVKHKDHTFKLTSFLGKLDMEGELVGMSKLLKYFLLETTTGKPSAESLKVLRVSLINFLHRTVVKDGREVYINNVRAFNSRVFIKHVLTDFSSIECE